MNEHKTEKDNNQHWIISVQDSINNYQEVQSGYFDGTKWGAVDYFKTSKPFSRYFGDSRYQITMKANPICLQYPE